MRVDSGMEEVAQEGGGKGVVQEGTRVCSGVPGSAGWAGEG